MSPHPEKVTHVNNDDYWDDENAQQATQELVRRQLRDDGESLWSFFESDFQTPPLERYFQIVHVNLDEGEEDDYIPVDFTLGWDNSDKDLYSEFIKQGEIPGMKSDVDSICDITNNQIFFRNFEDVAKVVNYEIMLWEKENSPYN